MNNKPDKKPQPNKLPKMRFNFYWLYGAIAVFLIFLNFTGEENKMKDIPYSQFQQYVEKGYVHKVVIVNKETAEVSIPENDTTALIEIFGASQAAKHTKAPQLTVSIPSSDRFD